MAKSNLISQRQFAKQLGVSPTYVGKLIREGKISTENGKIDAKKAAKELEENSDPRHDGRRKRDGNPNKGKAGFIAPGGLEDGMQMSLTRARAAEQVYRARLKQLEYEERVANLLDKNEVIQFCQNIIAITKTKIMSTADRLPPLIIGDDNEKRIRQIIRKELIIALEELAKLENLK